MLFSIGYEKITIQQLIVILKEYQIDHLIDVRSYPSSDKAGFNKNGLRWEINRTDIEYNWQGNVLGGRGQPITDAALGNLIDQVKGLNACLICQEHRPKNCHRFTVIGARLEKDPFNTETAHLIPVIDSEDNYVRCKTILTGSQKTLF